VHHVIAKRAGGSDEVSNLRALCKSCHSAIAAQRLSSG
jgi:5-methylcytosine-specific restriction endonuclease McrA